MRARLRGTRRRVYVFLGVLALAGLIEAGVVLAGVGTQRVSTTSRAGQTPATAALPASSNHALTASSASSGSLTSSGHVTVGHSVKNDTSRPLRSIRPVAIRPTPDHEANPNPKVPMKGLARPEAARQTRHFPNAMPGTGLNFDGIPFPGVTCNCAPPDTNGEVGATQYVQIVNEGFQVFNKTTGASVLGPLGISTIWAGFGGLCQSSGSGDPVVMYDQLAGRWFISQFAGTSTITDQCIAISTTSDATGTWNRYGFHMTNNFYDYPHFGVWPDGYYGSANIFNSSGTAFLGPQPFAFNRAAMLAGTAATFVSTGILASGDDALMPSDLDGSNPPPAGSPNPFVMAGTLSTIRVYRVHADFRTPANSASSLAATLTPPAFSVACPSTRACVPGPNGDRLDAIGDRPMFRNAYRRFNDGHEARVRNDPVCVANGGSCNPISGAAAAGVRWWEINHATSGTPTIVQASTFSPDNTSRWMGSAAMDTSGNLAACYSVSSAATVPGLRCAGRLAGDPINTLAQGESTMFAGVGSQSGTVNRWGDYSDLTIDPIDDCTFWFTSEYYPAGSTSFNWRTRIANFKFPSCTATGGTLQGTVTDSSTSLPIEGAHVDVSNGASTSTNAAGHYSITLAPDTYSATYSKSGYASQTVNGLVTTDGGTTTQDAALTPAADLSITKTADDSGVTAGDPMGFVVTLANAGSPTATGVDITDDLPAGTDVDWTLAGDSDAGWSVTGSPPDQHLVGPSSVAGNTSTHAHVVSNTTAESGGSYGNTASFTSDNAGSGKIGR